MKNIKRIAVLLLLTCLLMSICPAAFADQNPQTEYEDSYFEGLTWEEVMDKFIEQFGIDRENIGVGYINLVTGEEHYINPDQYFDAASMYKIPINMLFTSMISDGKIDWDTPIGGYKYSYCLQATIIDSNNDLAKIMWVYAGGYRTYRELIAPFMGEDPATAPAKYYENNFFTARQEIHCLNEFFTNNDRYPGMMEMLLQAEPYNYFRIHSHDVEIAHKYGYNSEVGHSYTNDSGIVFTEDPFAIVMFTDRVNDASKILGEFCDLMIDYTEYHTAERKRLEQEAAEAEAIAALEAKQQEEEAQAAREIEEASAAAAEAEYSAPTPAENTEKSGGNMITAFIFIALFFIFAVLYLIIRRMQHKKINLPWALGAVLTATLAMAVCVYAVNATPGVKDAEGNPQESVEAFFTAVENGNLEEAYTYLSGYNTLGIENEPTGDAAKLLYELLRGSYSYRLYGDCTKSGTDASQAVLFTSLDLTGLKADLQERTEHEVEKLVDELSNAEIYDENDGYLDSFLNTAYVNALNDLLSTPEKYYKTTGLVINLEYKDEMWKIIPDSELYSALSGNTSY